MDRSHLDIERPAPRGAQTERPAERDAKRLPFGSACVTRALPATRGRLQRDRRRRSSLRAMRERLTARAQPVLRRASRGLSRHALSSASLATSLHGAGTADQDTRRATTPASKSCQMEERIPLVVKEARLVGPRQSAPSPSAAGSAAHLLITSILYCSLPMTSPSPNGPAWEARREPVWRLPLTFRRDLKRRHARDTFGRWRPSHERVPQSGSSPRKTPLGRWLGNRQPALSGTTNAVPYAPRAAVFASCSRPIPLDERPSNPRGQPCTICRHQRDYAH